MAKRKAPTPAHPSEPPRRRLRSSGPVAETQPDSSPSQSRSGSPHVPSNKYVASLSPVAKRDKIRGKPPISLESTSTAVRSITNPCLDTDPSSDELNISSSIPQPPRLSTPKPAQRREVLHSVEIVTPKYRREIGPHNDSPSSVTGLARRDEDEIVPPPDSPHLLPISSRKRLLGSPSTPLQVYSTPAVSHTEGRSGILSTSASPSKNTSRGSPLKTSTSLPGPLPPHLHSCLHAQKKAIMLALRNNASETYEESLDDQDMDTFLPANMIAYQNICDLLKGTVDRGEGNSCLLIGPRGSGKTCLLDRALKNISDTTPPIVIRLCGHAQLNDRLAMREIAWQLTHQTGNAFLSEDHDGPGEGDFDEQDTTSLPPPAHLPTLISVLPNQSRPVIVILDAFDCFALHGRQALLYCLLDTAQSCQIGQGNNGIAIIGVTSRIDTINLLEKRVKSRFSGRMFRAAGPRKLVDWTKLARRLLLAAPVEPAPTEWSELWESCVDRFLADRKVIDALHDTWGLSKDFRVLIRVLASLTLDLTPLSPYLVPEKLYSSISAQRFPMQFSSSLSALSYPSTCLLIAAIHSQTSGHDTFTFEMLYQAFRDQVRTSVSAPVEVGGGSIGMVKCGRHVLMGAFEQLAMWKAFVPVVAPSATVIKEFIKYRCVIGRDDLKKAVERNGQTNLKKWLWKSLQSG